METPVTFKGVVYGILGFFAFFAVVFAIGFMASGSDFVLYKFFAPRRANVERTIYENTHSYTAGMVQRLHDQQFEFTKEKDPNAKSVLAGIILHDVGDYDENKLPPDLAAFINQLRRDYR